MFTIHHCNVDRIVELDEEIHNESPNYSQHMFLLVEVTLDIIVMINWSFLPLLRQADSTQLLKSGLHIV